MIYKDKNGDLKCDLKGVTYCFRSGRFFRGNGKETFDCFIDGCRVAMIDGKMMTASRFAWLAFYGTEPVGRVRTWNGDPADMRILNLRDKSCDLRSIHQVVWYDVYTGLIFQRGSNRELFADRPMEYVAGKNWTHAKLTEALGHRPRPVVMEHPHWQWVVKYRGRIVAKRFRTYEEATGWIEANNQKF